MQLCCCHWFVYGTWKLPLSQNYSTVFLVTCSRIFLDQANYTSCTNPCGHSHLKDPTVFTQTYWQLWRLVLHSSRSETKITSYHSTGLTRRCINHISYLYKRNIQPKRRKKRCPALWMWLELLAACGVSVAAVASYLQSGNREWYPSGRPQRTNNLLLKYMKL